ncbi:pitrilysin family protein [Notoacmeibacter sp. MSK16QG-6]|uniref:M16 family metallopeptidase n=1 Tax=Notoacmeibacter sp. MSK16QG-6 TaxID=2957982 RepID=UPI00209DF765|nr:pitrilysin family protein [Notoacmeibacter sp. MSK16QG-6]MCP1198504.1 insulinase family protein [Notoacmeibacter sp. MSK16QG-6]
MAKSLAISLLAFSLLFPAGGAALATEASTGGTVEANTAYDEVPNVSHFTLDNGLEIVVVPDRRAPVVTHMLWYKIGSADEAPGKSGIAHFFEHLMFKGTKKHPAGAFSQAVAEIGGEENAFTSYDYTAYYQQIPPSALKEMMAFEADRMVNLVLTDAVIGPERAVILEERNSRVENSPSALLREEHSATLWQNSPYGIPVIGWKHEMEQLNREDAIDFYTRYYAPNNAVLVVTGDVTAENVRAMAEDTYGKVPRGPKLPPRARPQEPEQNTARSVTLRDERVSVPSFYSEWITPSYHTARDQAETAALEMLAEVLGGGVRSRLYERLVVDDSIAQSVGASYDASAWDDGSFTVWGSPRGSGDIDIMQRAIREEIDRIAKDGVSDDELTKAKNRSIKSLIFARDSQATMARIYGSLLATGGKVEDVNEWAGHIRAVTSDQVKAAATRWLDEDRATTAYLLPPKEQATDADPQAAGAANDNVEPSMDSEQGLTAVEQVK